MNTITETCQSLYAVAAELKEKYPILTTFETLSLAVGIQRNNVLNQKCANRTLKKESCPVSDLNPQLSQNVKLIKDFLTKPIRGSGKLRTRISVVEIWCECFGRNRADLERRDSSEIHSIMRKMQGWEEGKTPYPVPGYGSQRIYKKTYEL